MFKKSDPNSFSKNCALYDGDNEIGTLLLEYQVTRYDDVQVQNASSVKKSRQRQYLIHATQRLNLYNPSGLVVKPGSNTTSYDNYPVLVQTSMLGTAAAGSPDDSSLSWELKDYSPKTINTTIQSSGTTGTSSGSTTASSTSHTSGSSTSQTNSYDTSVSVGMNDSLSDPTNIGISGSSTASYGHSSTTTHEHSTTHQSSSSQSRGQDSSSSAAMSIKDWGAYALVNPTVAGPTWLFGQEFPWNAIDCRKTTETVNPNNKDQVQIVVPSAMTARLYDGVSLYPPSQLSMFGVNFVMKSLWLVTIPDDSVSDEVTVSHTVDYYAGSHLLQDASGLQQDSDPSKVVNVYMDKVPTILNAASGPALSTTIDLALLALMPATVQGNAAVTGFSPNRFIVLPVQGTSSTPPVPFKIVSAGNDLLVVDNTTYPSSAGAAGFSLAETLLTANFSQSCAALSMTLYFKVVDTTKDYTLYLKHWKLGATGVMLTLTINGDTDNAITKYIDAAEAEGGENNITTIALRNQNYASVNYHDYLQLGLNAIQIDIQPIGKQYTADCAYQIRAVSVAAS